MEHNYSASGAFKQLGLFYSSHAQTVQTNNENRDCKKNSENFNGKHYTLTVSYFNGHLKKVKQNRKLENCKILNFPCSDPILSKCTRNC